ncbi:hypothetical protein CK216_10095 [Mesorhizobium sp. WSM3876]|nr:hypothetical protein CK216_10095 [Mesorhizobium sp. WSM3876]
MVPSGPRQARMDAAFQSDQPIHLQLLHCPVRTCCHVARGEREKQAQAARRQGDAPRPHARSPKSRRALAIHGIRDAMPALKDARWEQFCQFKAEGMPAYQAYLKAGYKCTEEAAIANSARLMRKDNIRARLKELIDDLADKMVVTRESLVAEYDQIIAAAHREKQYGAAATALAAKAKITGHDIQRSLNVNLTGTFSQLTDDELRFEVASMINEARAIKGQPPLALPGQPHEDERKH